MNTKPTVLDRLARAWSDSRTEIFEDTLIACQLAESVSDRLLNTRREEGKDNKYLEPVVELARRLNEVQVVPRQSLGERREQNIQAIVHELLRAEISTAGASVNIPLLVISGGPGAVALQLAVQHSEYTDMVERSLTHIADRNVAESTITGLPEMHAMMSAVDKAKRERWIMRVIVAARLIFLEGALRPTDDTARPQPTQEEALAFLTANAEASGVEMHDAAWRLAGTIVERGHHG